MWPYLVYIYICIYFFLSWDFCWVVWDFMMMRYAPHHLIIVYLPIWKADFMDGFDVCCGASCISVGCVGQPCFFFICSVFGEGERLRVGPPAIAWETNKDTSISWVRVWKHKVWWVDRFWCLSLPVEVHAWVGDAWSPVFFRVTRFFFRRKWFSRVFLGIKLWHPPKAKKRFQKLRASVRAPSFQGGGYGPSHSHGGSLVAYCAMVVSCHVWCYVGMVL